MTSTNITELKQWHEKLLGTLATKHTTFDSTFYIVNEGKQGYKIIKFYDDNLDYRITEKHMCPAEAYSYAILYM